MANIDTTSFINLDELTDAQRLSLKSKLQKRKKTAKRKYRRRG